MALVKRSAEGLSAAELSERLGMNGHSFLSGLAAHPELHRQKFGGRFVCFAAEATLRAQQQRCARCGGRLAVLKTRRGQRVLSLHLGPFVAVETVRSCAACGEAYGSRELAGLVAPGCNFACDVVVYVGRALFVRHRNEIEVAAAP